VLLAAVRTDETLACPADQTSASKAAMSNESASCQRSASPAVSAPVSNGTVQQLGRLTVLDGGIRLPADVLRVARSIP
jgi:hypothetical protein